MAGSPFWHMAILEQLYYIWAVLASWIRGLGAAKYVEVGENGS